ncbi:violacein biosynthesis enzyme VioE [Janthinobacterium sp. SUN100]|uniref:violacein biosynthesis enzyme VioE n=1 Tax=Janthinobacterium sp. SUN100 TaxID=3004101 RepID=UPI0025AFE842|nr:violacein biosynthesis enzyme VioE [Janthinobacterium sp. SUN100]MDN2701177.1 violacein biosynthesis enzyme VioE [Janthinobacterium sp. SUN100]
MPTHVSPPLLPMQWSSAYISYWTPMQEDDQVTSGYCWFDYARNICRIDGLFNPWSEKEHGHLLWMSEIGDARREQSRKQKVSYARQAQATGEQLQGTALADEVTPFHELFLPQAVLLGGGARHDGRHTVLGREADAWVVERTGKPSSVFYLEAGGNRLLRMVTGNDPQHLSVRDFPNLFVGDIPDSVFTSCNT